MAEVNPLSQAEIAFLSKFLPNPVNHNESKNAIKQQPRPSSASDPVSGATTWRPYVTLTYACSLDSMISLAPGVRTTLSGPETKSMTHFLRLHHDAILVGAGTAIADDPSLNCRYPDANLEAQPRPVVLDPGMRWNVGDSKVAKLAMSRIGKAPWVIQRNLQSPEDVSTTTAYERLLLDEFESKQTPSHNYQPSLASGKMPWSSILKVLKDKGVRSVMIEGGATIINDLLREPTLVDAAIVTIAPTWLGQGGVAVSPKPKTEANERVNAARLSETTWRQFGQDVVLCGRLSE